MSEQPPKLFHENLERILDLILQLASGNFDARLSPSDAGTTLDALAVGLNMLAEELKSSVQEREQALKSLGASEQKFRAITDMALDAVIVIDDEGRITLWNPAAEKVFGYPAEEAIGQNIHLWLAPDEYHETYKKNWPKFRESGEGPVIGVTFEARAVTRHRGEIPIELSVSSAHLNDKWHAIGIARDISERKAMERSVTEEREMLRVIDDTLSSFIVKPNAKRAFEIVLNELLKLSGSECGFLQDRRTDENGAPHMRTLAMSELDRNGETRPSRGTQDPKDLFKTCEGLNTDDIFNGEIVIDNAPVEQFRGKDLPTGHPSISSFLGIPLKRGETVIGAIGLANRRGGYDMSFVDRITPFITAIAEVVEANQNEEARRKSEQRTARMANYDELTGLPNRSQFKERLLMATKRAERYSERCALLLLDLDHFKDVNDTLGHPVGDALLSSVARRLTSVTRESDIVARLGGDEFAVLQINLTDSKDAATFAQRLIDVMTAPFDIAGHRIHTETSIGIALCTPDNLEPTRLFSQADTALYRAKAAGRHRYRFHDAQVEAEVRQRVALVEELHAACAGNQFELYYQPQVDTRRQRLVGVEALLRWNHPERGLLGPGAFIRAAETSGCLLDIEDWVLRQACRQMSEWQVQGLLETAIISVNLSPLQFKTAEFENSVLSALEEAGLSPQCLELEITERSVAERPEAVAPLIERLTATGIRFSIDDFGTGYSSLQYLKKLPVSKIKVAQEFVADMLSDPSDASIVRAIISLGHELGYEVIAEGVETEAQRDFLQDRGCFLFQGYLFGRPSPASQMTEHLRNGLYAAKGGGSLSLP
ncbi:bifunctional diguanylate cyclase/phosphodiesterase [Thalassovita aquimarina]|uniref:bifunctional diguanylate cyclase/phosphodiesterase n=1 Tax=Thalassovita aquimarina TaxID=2785917 RepID=UPI003565EE5C